MVIKVLCALAAACLWIWFCFDQTIYIFLGAGVTSIGLVYTLFGKKTDSAAVSDNTTMNIKSGKDSINAQSRGDIHINKS